MNRNTPTPIAYLIVAFCALFAAISIISFSEGDLASLESSIRRNLAQVTSTVYESAKYEAESGALTAPLLSSSDANASGGLYVSSKTVDSGSVNVPITINKAGTFYIWGRVLSPTYSNDSFYVSVDGGAKDIWDTAEGLWSTKWQWTRVTGRALNGNSPVQLNATGRPFQLAAGVHTVTFQARDANTGLDAIVVTNDPSFVPTDAQPVPEIKKVTLTVTTAGTGTGTVSGGVINCGSTCSQTTTIGNSVSVSAAPASGSTFSGWSGACTGTTLCTVTLDADATVVATFTAIPQAPAPTPTPTPTPTTTTTQPVTQTVTEPVTTTQPVTTTTQAPAPTPTPTVDTTTTTVVDPVTNPVEAVVNTTTQVAAVAAPDTNPPSAPGNLRAVAIAKTSVSLAWDVPADNVGVTSYVVYRNNTKITTVTSPYYVDGSRRTATTYTYKVTAVDAAGNVSPASADLKVTTIANSALLFKVGDQVLVTSTTNVRSSAGSNRKVLGTQSTGAIGRISTGPVWVNSYWWWNINFDSGVDGWAVENYLTKYTAPTNTADTTAPSVPTNLRASGVSTSEVNITWNTSTDNVGVAGYKLYRNGSIITTQTANSYADSGLQAGTSYLYTVGSYDAAGNNSSLSGAVTGTTLSQPVVQTYTLTVSRKGTGSGSVSGGSIACGTTCSQTATSGTALTLNAVPAAGSTFVGWSGACSGTAACTVTLTSDVSVAAQFDLAPVVVPSYPITVTKAGTGSGTVTGGAIACGTTCSQTVDQNTAVTLTATPSSGSTFSGWSGACSGTGSCTVTVTGTTAVTATFTVIPPSTYSLSVSTTGTGSGTVTGGSISCGSTCSQTSTSGTVVTLTAAAASGSTFSGWSGACSGSSPTCNVTLTANASVSASFTQNVVVTPPPTPSGTAWYASPTGSASGAGTLASPWDLKTALAGGNGKIQAGHTLYLRGGTYTGLFTSTLTGTSASPIVVRSAPGEWAIIDGAPFADSTQVALLVNGAYTWYRDFEVMNSNTDRPVDFPYRPATVNVYGVNTKFINMLIHDGGQGIGLWDQSASAEVHGNIIYNNGGEARDHGIYTQNNGAGTSKEISNNVIFNSYGYAIHAYGSGANGYPLLGYVINENTFVNDNSIIGNRPVQNLVFKNNSLYNSSFNFGYFGSNNVNGSIENNWFASPLVEFSGWKNMSVKNNKFWKTGSKAGALMNIFYYSGYALTDYTFTGNKYFQFDPWESIDWGASFPTTGGFAYTFGPGDCCLINPYNPSPKPTGNGTWQGTLGYDKDGSYVQSLDGHPTGTDVIVRPNKYETGRATISIYNWDNKPKVTVDLSNTGLVAGDTYELHNAQNYKAQVITGQYNGTPITIDMKYFTGTTPWSVVAPVGNVPALSDRPLSFPEFGVFVINKKQ